MAAPRAYLDWNASAPLCEAARAAAVAALDIAANPSSVHSEGRRARQLIEIARRQVASLVKGSAEHVVFTSGATEAASLLDPRLAHGTLAAEVGASLCMCRGSYVPAERGRFAQQDISRIGVDANGLMDLAGLTAALAGHDRAASLPLVAVHAVNNETGVIQPLAEIASIVRAARGVLVLDAVQAAGRIPLDMTAGVADYLILSSHKIGGPKGAGTVVGAAGLMMPMPLITGGGQERGFRAGTENLAAIAGFGAAAGRPLKPWTAWRWCARFAIGLNGSCWNAARKQPYLVRPRRVSPTRHSLRCPASRPKRRRSRLTLPGWRCRLARPARRARSAPATSCRRWVLAMGQALCACRLAPPLPTPT